MSIERSFLDCLVKKLAFAKEIEQLGMVTDASQKDTLRQIKQVSKSQNGDVISGEGATKSEKVPLRQRGRNYLYPSG